MQIAEFRTSLTETDPPADLGKALAALWYAAKGNWDRAHDLAQSEHSTAGAWVHAYLHRVEGDQENAAYWYRRAGKPVADSPLDEEWTAIAAELLASPRSAGSASGRSRPRQATRPRRPGRA